MDHEFVIEQMPWWCQQMIRVMGQFPAVATLLGMMTLDVVSGLCRAVYQRRLNSDTSFKGMMKKASMLIVLGMGAMFEPYSGGLPLTKMISVGFIIMEAISILENAEGCGVKVPFLRDVLSKLRTSEVEGGKAMPTEIQVSFKESVHLAGTVDTTPTSPALDTKTL